MRKFFFSVGFSLLLAASSASAQQATPQTSPQTTSTPQTQTRAAAPPQAGSNLEDYGVRIAPEPRLIVMMAALEAAGWEATPKRSDASDSRPAEVSAFRAEVRRDLQTLDPNLRERMQAFYRLRKLPASATPAEQAARYVSLAFALGDAPTFEPPERSDDLPADLLEVLDFAPLVREFYQKSGFAERMPAYLQAYRAEGDNLRRPVAEMLRTTLSYLHTRPVTTYNERVTVSAPKPAPDAKKKRQTEKRITELRERERQFHVVPDLLAAPGAIQLRVIADDYYAIVPFGADPTTSELRRAYLQFVADPLIARYNKEIALKRQQIRQLLDERKAANPNLDLPDIFTAVARSFVAAADVRLNETQKLRQLEQATSAELRRIAAAKPADAQARREALTKETQAQRAALEDEATAQLAAAFERGAVLSFYFADQLRGAEISGFDVSNFFADMVNSFDPARESKRLAEAAPARERIAEARKRAREEASKESSAPDDSPRRAALAAQLKEVGDLLRLKKYTEAEARLRPLMQEYPGEPHVLFALGQAASISAEDAFDEQAIQERLNRALANYRLAANAASPDTDRALIARAHVAAGRILVFLKQPAEAAKEFDAAIALGDKTGIYEAAKSERQKLGQTQ